jgi:hypothetical protein
MCSTMMRTWRLPNECGPLPLRPLKAVEAEDITLAAGDASTSYLLAQRSPMSRKVSERGRDSHVCAEARLLHGWARWHKQAAAWRVILIARHWRAHVITTPHVAGSGDGGGGGSGGGIGGRGVDVIDSVIVVHRHKCALDGCSFALLQSLALRLDKGKKSTAASAHAAVQGRNGFMSSAATAARRLYHLV